MRYLLVSTGLTLAALAAAAAAPVRAQSTGLEDMVGARAGQAEAELQRRGYVNTRGEKGDDRAYSYWWSADRRQCVSIATMGGRYTSVQATVPPDCRQPANLRPSPGYGRSGDDAEGDPGDRPVVAGRDVDLGLICFGDGSKSGLATGTTWTWNRKRDRYEYGQYTETERKVFDASVTIQMWGDGGRIRLPKSMIPPLNSRGDQGWWDLSDLSIGPDIVRATYRLNGLNKPRITIDRRSGRITITGTADYGFRGTCDQIAHGPRRF